MPEFWLDHLKGARAGVVDHFEQLEVVRVGRNDEGELIFDEAGVSWEHAEIRLRGDEFWVIDQGSTNGTYVNDERAHNARLKDGDVLRFGKKGPVMRFKLNEPKISESSGERPKAPPPKPGKRKRAPSEPEIAIAVLGEREREHDPSRRHSDLPPAAVPRPPTASPLNTAITVLLGALVLVSLFLLGFLYLDYTQLEDELEQARARATEATKQVTSLKLQVEQIGERARTEGRAEGRDSAEQELKGAKAKVRRLEQELERKKQRLSEGEKRLAQLETQLRSARQDRSQGDSTWQQIERTVSPSVLLIAVELTGKKPDGSVVNLGGFGTGFFASSQGDIVTNKHVVEPWKFRKLALRIAKEKIQVDHESYKIHAWRGGTRFLHKVGGKVKLDPKSGYSTTTGTLELLRTAPDEWTDVQPGQPVKAIRIHAAHGNGDLAILRARNASRVVPLVAGRSSTVNRLDEVLVVGFPAGPAVLEAGVAETSPATGQVRKIERTIQVSAPMIPGNSGGPLIDKRGRVIGVCTMIHQDATLGSCLKIEHAMRLIHGGSW